MTPSLRTAAAVLTVGVLILTASPAQAQGVWTAVPSPNEPGRDFLLGADASDAGHVWAVGRLVARSQFTSHSRVLRYDGTAWQPAALTGFPGNDALVDVDAVSATDAWAAGSSYSGVLRSSTLVARWNGSVWSPEATPNTNPSGLNNLTGVAAAGGTVWAVGTAIDTGSPYHRRALILQRSGGAWRVTPAPRISAFDNLEGVDATGPADAWAVGWSTDDLFGAAGRALALRWSGTGWQSVPVAGSTGAALYAVDALTATAVWAAGSIVTADRGRQPYVARFDGTSWRRVATPTIDGGGQLTDIVALSPSNVVAVGTAASGGTSLILHWDGTTWTRETTTSNATLAGVAAVASNTFWAVGNRIDLSSSYEERTFTTVRS